MESGCFGGKIYGNCVEEYEVTFFRDSLAGGILSANGINRAQNDTAIASFGKTPGQVNRGRGLAGAAFMIRYG